MTTTTIINKIDALAADLVETATKATIAAFSELTVLAFARGVITYAQFASYDDAIDEAKRRVA